MECSYVWNRLDTRFALSAFQLTQLEPSICGIESSLLPTPRKEGYDSQGEGHGDLQYEVKKLWRTPNSSIVTGGGQNAEQRLANGHAMQLSDQVLTPKLWPTPIERDWKSTSHAAKENSRPLSEAAGLTGSGSLNPRFVEELMGFPIDHTALKRSATRLFRNKRFPFSKQSIKSNSKDETGQRPR